MPIISQIGRKDPKVRALHAAIYLVLILGAVTMVYPFLIMVSGSTKSAVDLSDFDLFPRFLRDDALLYRKHMEGLFNESVDNLNVAYGLDTRSFDAAEPPARPNRALADAWRDFLAETDLPPYTRACGYLQASVSKTLPESLRDFKTHLAERFGKDIADVNRAIGADFVGWNAFYIIPEDYLPRRNVPQATPFMEAFWDFKGRQAPGRLYYFSAEGFYKKLFLKTQYSRDIAEYNRAHDTDYASYDQVHLTRQVPAGTAKEREDWEVFVRNTLNLLWVRVERDALPVYRDFLKAKYGTIDVLNRNYGTTYASFRQVPLIE
ncbi:MAG: hypothetical protein JXB04_12690, partial [Kiritimatiellae bacterium]|nr:hypothetical protein [Kiritimatiellia bacterium]